MAFLSRGIGDNDSDIRPAASRTGTPKILRWVVVPCLGVALACWAVATLAGLHSAASLAYGGDFARAGLPMAPASPGKAAADAAGRTALVAAAANAPSAHFASSAAAPAPTSAFQAPVNLPADPFADVVTRAKLSREKLIAAFVGTAPAKAKPAAAAPADPFADVVARAKLSRASLLAAFASAGMAVAQTEDIAVQPVELAAAVPDPVAARFHSLDARAAESRAPKSGAEPRPAETEPTGSPFARFAPAPTGLGVELAYAAAEASPDDPFELALASLGDDPFGDDLSGADAGASALLEGVPDSVDVVPAVRPQRETAKPSARKPANAGESDEKPESGRELAYARPDNPAGGVFKNLFGSPKAGGKVAVYDISAAVVHMPDGTKLEAHSGIGKMADNPRYVHVKMKGPTPPNTYKLTMREKLFHGVEAIRMTPVGEQTMHGRDGMLAHSYLLRGGREESHGCVAFANYPKFLKAFKQGKITHMIVVPSMSKLPKVQMVSNSGRGA